MHADVITLLTKLRARDSKLGKDVWYKYEIHDVEYTVTDVVNSTGSTVSIGQVFTILIPFSSRFLKYHKWRSEDRDYYYSVTQESKVVLGVLEEEEINISEITNKYSDILCDVESVQEVSQKYDVKYQLKLTGK